MQQAVEHNGAQVLPGNRRVGIIKKIKNNYFQSQLQVLAFYTGRQGPLMIVKTFLIGSQRNASALLLQVHNAEEILCLITSENTWITVEII